jgi:hypothetical protein
MGRERAQAVASMLIQEQPARCIAMSGICAGRRGKVALGDVIFADRLWSYDAGKLIVEDGVQRFQGDVFSHRPQLAWVQRMQRVSIPATGSWLAQWPLLPLEHQEDWVMLRLLAGEDPRRGAAFDTACPEWSVILPTGLLLLLFVLGHSQDPSAHLGCPRNWASLMAALVQELRHQFPHNRDLQQLLEMLVNQR